MKNTKENINLIHKIQRYIQHNVSSRLPLEKLAKEANYSTFHFQKIFKSVVGETPKQYIKRVRIENTSHLISLKPNTSLIEIAFDCGFTSLETFSRAFKNYYGISPNFFRKMDRREKNKILQSKINNADENVISSSSYFLSDDLNKLEVKIIKLPLKKIIYIPITLSDIATITNAYKKIKNWAFARELFQPNTQLFALMKDNPEYTSLNKCRFETCIEVDKKPEISDNIFYQEIPSNIYATFKVDGGINELIKAVTQFSLKWLPDSGFEIKHSPALIVPLDNPIINHPHEISYDFHIAISPK